MLEVGVEFGFFRLWMRYISPRPLLVRGVIILQTFCILCTDILREYALSINLQVHVMQVRVVWEAEAQLLRTVFHAIK